MPEKHRFPPYSLLFVAKKIVCAHNFSFTYATIMSYSGRDD